MMDDSAGLSLEDSLRKRRLEMAYQFKFEDCSKEDLIQILLQSNRKNELLEANLKESLLNFKSVDFNVSIPEQPKPELGMFTNLIIQFLSANDLTIYKQGQPFKSQLVAEEILAQSEKGIEWLNYCVSCSIANLTENQLRAFSDDDVAMVDTLLKSKTLSIYVGTKILKQLIDRLASSAYLSNQQISNETFTNNETFLKLVEVLYFTCYPKEDN